MEETLISLAKLSPIVAILAFIVWKQWQRVDRYEAAAELREAANAKACSEREQRMALRLNELENRQYQDSLKLISNVGETQRINAEATRTFSRALDRWIDHNDIASGKHESRQ